MALHVDPRFYQAGPFDNGSTDKLTMSPEAFKTIFGPYPKEEAAVPKNNDHDWPDLSQWYEVPAGATIPAGTPYVYSWGDSFMVGPGASLGFRASPGAYFTENPIRNPLPQAPGTVIELKKVTSLEGDEVERTGRAMRVCGTGLWVTTGRQELADEHILDWELIHDEGAIQ